MAIDTIKSTAVLDGAITNDDLANDIAINTSGAITTTGAFTSKGIDDNADATALTITSDEEVLIGKTTDAQQTAGTALYPSGQIYNTASGTHPLVVTRKTNDGAIALFYKDTNEVGRIGTVSNTVGIHGAGSGDDAVGLLFVESGSGQRIVPCQENFTSNNGIVNLGWSTNRFKDAYLSGGVYLGGTGSANKLDDYEEGTFTPQWDGYAPANSQGRYTKIGNQVIVHAHLVTNTAADYSGVRINNLPFTSSNVAGVGAGMTWCDNTYFYDFVTHTRVYPASTQCILNLVHNGSLQAMEYVGRTPQIGGSGTFRWTIIYQTDS